MSPSIDGIWPINIIDHTKNAAWGIPSADTLGNIPFLRKILRQIFQDWKAEAAKYNVRSNTDVTDEMVRFFDAVDVILPKYVQSLLSYITFFFMVENGYHLVYSQLNQLNGTLGLHLPHSKPPQKTEFLERLWVVRNYSIAHWSGTEKKHLVDSIAGRDWGVFWSHNVSLEELQFGATGTSNRRLEPIPEIHRLCSLFLDEFDEVCATYLIDLKSRLPLKIDGREYSNPEEYKTVKFRVLGNPST